MISYSFEGFAKAVGETSNNQVKRIMCDLMADRLAHITKTPVPMIHVEESVHLPSYIKSIPTYTVPSAAAFRSFLLRRNLKQREAAKMAYLRGGESIRKYTGGAAPHKVSGAVWFALHAKTILDKETISYIESEMERSATSVE